MTEQTTDERCAMLARDAMANASAKFNYTRGNGHYAKLFAARVVDCADRIIALRTQQAESNALRDLDARDNRNLRAYGLPEIR